VDAPETVYYVREIVPPENINYPKLSMWQLIVKMKAPPLRISRYCCSELKERGGEGRFVVTGVRWAESARRKKQRGNLEVAPKRGPHLILNADNDDSRRMLETCSLQGKRILNPIIDWTDDDVWEFLRYYGCRSNPLYGCGFKRIGCVGCPMAGGKEQMREFERYPKYRQMFVHAFDRMIASRRESGLLTTSWKTGEEVFEWWVSDTKSREYIDPEQLTMLEDSL
jgi:phosphoadenosine phosphosulfate reductase